MILDRIGNLPRYFALHPLLGEVAVFLEGRDWLREPPGRYDLPGRTDAWISRQDVDAHPRDGAAVEFHRRYIDLQYVLQGEETMGWSPLEAMPPDADFDVGKDFALVPGGPVASWIAVHPGFFAVFLPTDAHAPCCGTGRIRKLVVKIPVEP